MATLRDELSAFVDTNPAWLRCATADCDGELYALIPADSIPTGRTLLCCDRCGMVTPWQGATMAPVDWDGLERRMKFIAREAGRPWPPRRH